MAAFEVVTAAILADGLVAISIIHFITVHFEVNIQTAR
jgi:hypothetical protein